MFTEELEQSREMLVMENLDVGEWTNKDIVRPLLSMKLGGSQIHVVLS